MRHTTDEYKLIKQMAIPMSTMEESMKNKIFRRQVSVNTRQPKATLACEVTKYWTTAGKW